MSMPGCSLQPFTGNFSLFFFFSLAIPQFGLPSHVSSLRLSSGHWGLILTLSNAARTSLFSSPYPPYSPPPPHPPPRSHPSTPIPACWWQMRASGLLLLWELQLSVYSVVVFCFVLFPSGYVALWYSQTPTDPPVRGFPNVWRFFTKTPSPGQVSVPLFSLFCLLYFVLPPFEENDLPFWVPDVLHQHSEIALWKLLSIQMIFWWISGGKSSLLVLFFCYVGTTPFT